MGTKLQLPKKPLNKTEAKKDDYKNWDDEPKKYKMRKRSKFNYQYIQVAARLVAAGHTESDLGYVLGVKPCTIQSWKERYPQFKQACLNGKEMARNYLVSKGLRAAGGYDYSEETFELRAVEGEDEKQLICIKRVNKHQKPDGNLLTFFLVNMDSKHFSFTKNIKVDQSIKTVNLELTGQIESKQIREFAGKLLEAADKQDKIKKVESKIVQTV